MNTLKPEIKKLYYSIGEVSEITGLKQYVLRYWETEFKQLNPPKNRAGNRTFRQKDIDTILQIKELLYQQKFTIDGARKMLNQHVSKPADLETAERPSIVETTEQTALLKKIKQELQQLLEIINE